MLSRFNRSYGWSRNCDYSIIFLLWNCSLFLLKFRLLMTISRSDNSVIYLLQNYILHSRWMINYIKHIHACILINKKDHHLLALRHTKKTKFNFLLLRIYLQIWKEIYPMNNRNCIYVCQWHQLQIQ